MTVRYSVAVERPTDHRAQFEIGIEAGPGPSVDIVLPVWVPGSYVLRPTARNLRGMRAALAPTGPELPLERTEKSRWRVTTSTPQPLRVRYEVYGHDIIVEALDVTPEHLFLNAALCLPYVDGRKDEPCELAVHVSPDWKVYTELAEIGRNPPTFRAANYDELVDSPIDCGTPTVLTATARGVPHRIVLCGKGGNYEAHRLESDLGKIGEAVAKLFGELPMPSYTYFFHLVDRRDGGLEHRTSTSIVVPRTIFRPESDYQSFLSLAAHEYFHLFNVKRIRPKVLGPFDYTKENYTRLLWAMEGTTDYYGPLLLRRAGLLTPAKYLEGVAKNARRYLDTPGRLVTSLEDASFGTWLDLYQPYEETVNQSVSYYLKGGLVSLCLDLEIRKRTENRASLDDVWRRLWRDYGAKDRGLEEDAIPRLASEVSGFDLTEFFQRYVGGTAELDLAGVARHAGLEFGPKEKGPEPEEDGEPGYLGVDVENANGLTKIRTVRDGSPARRAGLSPGDEIVALDSSRVPFDQFAAALKRFPPGSGVDVALFRRGWLTHVAVTTGKGLSEKFRFRPLPDADALAQKIYASWLEAPWEPAPERARTASA
ncbi:MAG: PDZ domain-containing protein [Thermoplasmata archaeon]|nr:PDZ domain-containing protein [Thermoplasmata archaeon]